MAIQKGAERTPHDLSHFVMSAGKLGQLQTLSAIPVIAGDSFEQNLTGSFRLSQLRRGLAVDANVQLYTFYIPYRHIYGDKWTDMMKDGITSTPIAENDVVSSPTWRLSFLALNTNSTLVGGSYYTLPVHLRKMYQKIYNEYFKLPWEADDERTLAQICYGGANQPEGDYGFFCGHMKAIWNTMLPPDKAADNQTNSALGTVSGDEAIIDLRSFNQSLGQLHSDEERTYFTERYRDIMEGFGGYANPDVDERPKLLMRSELWASGYDVDGTDQTTLGQYSGRVQQNFSHRVPRAYIPEHGMVWTMALVRFPPILATEAHYLNKQSSITYENIAGDPAIVGNATRKTVKMSDLRSMGVTYDDSFDMPHSQWYRTHPNTIHGDYNNLQGFPFLDNYGVRAIQSIDEMKKVYNAPYDQMFITNQLGHWNMQAKNNVTVMRNLPSARDVIMTS
tara:strand:+ start:1164 stop:2510 length:1347 start_codon:yes stop_codon:yes gene_type:complete